MRQPADPDSMISPSSGPSRVGFAARAPRGFALDRPCERRVKTGEDQLEKIVFTHKFEVGRFSSAVDHQWGAGQEY